MSINNIQKKLVVVADDFTGANDVGVQFRKAGLKVNVIINTQHIQTDLELADVLVVDLESRFDLPGTAYRKCYDLGIELHAIGNNIIYKKIDSTFRGNIGAEIDGLMDAMKLKLAILAPALPSSGRTTRNGEVYVYNVKLEETEFALDPRTPVKHSRIADILALQSSRTSREISSDSFSGISSSLADELLTDLYAEPKILIFDSLEEEDLLFISRLVLQLSAHPVLIIGSAGLANYISKAFFEKKEAPAFVFSGSVSEQTRKQIHHALTGALCKVILIKAEHLLSDVSDYHELIAMVAAELEHGTTQFIFTSALTRDDVQHVFALSTAKGLQNEEAAEKVAVALGRLAAIMIHQFNPAGVLLTGGDTAIKTLRALGGTGFNIDHEIVPGVPVGRITGTDLNTAIATKSGGFGAEDAISKTLEFFKA